MSIFRCSVQSAKNHLALHKQTTKPSGTTTSQRDSSPNSLIHMPYNMKNLTQLLLLSLGTLILQFHSAPACAAEDTYGYNHQAGYEAAAQSNRDPLVASLISVRHTQDMGRLFMELTEVNRHLNALNLGTNDFVFGALSGIPLVGGAISGALETATKARRASTTGLEYGTPANSSMPESRIEFLFHRDPTMWEQLHWNSDTRAAYQKVIHQGYTDQQILHIFKSAIDDIPGQTSRKSMRHLHQQIPLRELGMLGCDPSNDCQRYQAYLRIYQTPPIDLPISPLAKQQLDQLWQELEILRE